MAWPLYDLPGGAEAYAVQITPTAGSTSIGVLVVAGRTGPNELFDTHAGRMFNGPVPVVVEGMMPTDAGTYVSTSNAQPIWAAVADAAVITAKIPDLDAGRWTWRHDGLIWTVIGTLGAEQYVAGLIEAQGAGSDPFNFQGLRGDLEHRFPSIPAVHYWDLSRIDTLNFMQTAPLWTCTESVYYSYVAAADDADPEIGDERSLFIDVSQIASGCDDNFVAAVLNDLETSGQLRREDIAGRSVLRSDREIIYVAGDTVIHFSSEQPETLTEMQLVIAEFLRGQPD